MSFPENLQIIMLSIAVSIGFCVVACLFVILVNTHLENQRLESMTLWNKDQNGMLIRTSYMQPNRSSSQEEVVIDTSPPEELIREESLGVPSDHANDDIIEEIQEMIEVEPISRPKQVRLKNKSYMDEWRPEQQILGLDFSRRYQYPPSITINIEDADSSAGSTLIVSENDHTDTQSIYSSISSSGESSNKSDFNHIEEIEINWVGKPGHEIFLPNSYESCYLYGFNRGRESAIIVTAS